MVWLLGSPVLLTDSHRTDPDQSVRDDASDCLDFRAFGHRNFDHDEDNFVLEWRRVANLTSPSARECAPV